MTLLRPGRVTVDELAWIAPVSIAGAVTEELEAGQVALSPGMKYRHYAPGAPLVLLDGDLNEVIEYINSEKLTNVAVLCYADDEESIRSSLSDADIYILGSRDNIGEQAQHLFSILRQTDKHNYSKIYAPLPQKDGLGLALYNRLIRAAAHTIINLRQGRNG